jgi:hypothetical protein
MYCHRSDAGIRRRTGDADVDFAAVGDQQLTK